MPIIDFVIPVSTALLTVGGTIATIRMALSNVQEDTKSIKSSVRELQEQYHKLQESISTSVSQFDKRLTIAEYKLNTHLAASPDTHFCILKKHKAALQELEDMEDNNTHKP